MVTVCLTCGGSGFELALDNCHKCQNYAVHRYCRKVLPKDFSEDTIWFCEDCEPDVTNRCANNDSGSPRSGFRASDELEEVQSNMSSIKFRKNQTISITSSESEVEDDPSEGSPHRNKPERIKKDNNERNLKRRRILFIEEEEEEEEEEEKADEDKHWDDSGVKASDRRSVKNSEGLKGTIVNGSQAKIKDGDLLCQEKCNSDIKLGSGRLVLEDDELLCRNNYDNNTKLRKQRKLILDDEEAQPLGTSLGPVNVTKFEDVLQQNLVAGFGAKTMVQIRENNFLGDDLQHEDKCDNDAKLGEQRRLVSGEEEEEEEEPQPLVTSRFPVSDVKASNIFQQKLGTASEVETELQIREAKHPGDEAPCRKESDKDQKLRKQQRFVTEELGAEPLRTSRVAVSSQKSRNLSEQSVMSGSVAKPKALENGQPSAMHQREKYYKDQNLKVQPRLKTFSNTKPSNILQRKVILEKELDSRPNGTQQKKLSKDQEPRKQRRLILEEDDDECLGTSQLALNNPKTSNIVNTGSAAEANMEIHACRPSSNDPTYTEKCHDGMKLGKQRRQVHNCAELNSLKTSSHSLSDPKPSHDLQKKFTSESETKTQIRGFRRSGIELEHRDRHVKDCELEKQKSMVFEDEGVEHLKTSRASVIDGKHSKILEHKVAPGSVDKENGHIRENKPSGILHGEKQHRDKYDSDQKFRERRRISRPNVICGSKDKLKGQVNDRSAGFEDRAEVQNQGGNRLSGNYDGQCMEKRDKNQNFREQLTFSRKEEADCKLKRSNIPEQASSNALPMKDPVWKGTLRITNQDSSTVNRFLARAHLSTLANFKASDMAKSFSECVSLKTFSRSQLWPECFQSSGPSPHHIALYFFPDSRDELTFDRLINKMRGVDLATRAVFKHAELLIFTSYELPVKFRKVRSKYFLWGVFQSNKNLSPADMSRSHPSNMV